MTLTITLPFPPAGLSPNARLHWSKRAPITADYKRTAWALTLSAMGRNYAGACGPVRVDMTFHPARSYQYDVDNLQARMKAALDGIAQALGIDDREFRPSSQIGAKWIGGAVEVVITPAAVAVPFRGVIR